MVEAVSEMVTVGIDPDTKGAGLAVLYDGRVEDLHIIRARSAIEMCRKLSKTIAKVCRQHSPHVVVVEGQQIYQRSKVRPSDIITLAHVAGAAMSGVPLGIKISCPLPASWKGQAPKKIHQGRIMEKLHLRHVEWLGISRGEWSEAVDAAGLALWGYHTWRRRVS